MTQGARTWVAVYLEPLTLGLAILLVVAVALALAEAANDKRRPR